MLLALYFIFCRLFFITGIIFIFYPII
ncbi:hypothetical protein PI27_gp032 [Listeria phage WIL-1]|nr:hypothetical protein PI27_gp032 [Listeria phage WIL-1]